MSVQGVYLTIIRQSYLCLCKWIPGPRELNTRDISSYVDQITLIKERGTVF